MSNSKETLKSLLISMGLTEEEAAQEYVNTIDADAARKLLDLLMAGAGGQSYNLPAGGGGFLTGLRKIVDARAKTQKAAVPENPRDLKDDEKDAAIQDHEQVRSVTDEEFVSGMKLLLTARTVEGIQKFARWPGELSDPDFPRSMNALESEMNAKNEELTEALRKKFEEERASLAGVLRKHRTQDKDE